MAELNEFTLSIMANRNKYDKYKKSIDSASSEEAANEIFRKEKMYYKERILHMTRDLFNERCENDDINRGHHEYIKSCIEYLKWNDITDMIEEDTRSEVRADENPNNSKNIFRSRNELRDKIQTMVDIISDDSNAENDAIDNGDDDLTHPSSSAATHISSLLSIANKMCIRKKTIDDFIVFKPVNNDDDIKAKLPKVRDYHNEIMKRASDAD
jgi:hypothetical protein